MLQLAAAAVVLASSGSCSAVVRQCIEGSTKTKAVCLLLRSLGEAESFWWGRTREGDYCAVCDLYVALCAATHKA
jgi:hypothetical protein